jgi:hypothetical protein
VDLEGDDARGAITAPPGPTSSFIRPTVLDFRPMRDSTSPLHIVFQHVPCKRYIERYRARRTGAEADGPRCRCTALAAVLSQVA